MKKVFILILICLLAYTSVCAYPSAEAVEVRVQHAAAERAQAEQFLSAVKNGDRAAVKQLLAANTRENLFLVSDAYGNTVLHIASDGKMFALLWNAMPEEIREQLLSRKNHIGEIPLMSQINYGREDLFLYYFPRTKLYERLTRTSAELTAGGVMGEIAQIKRADLLEECSAAGQTMWQRANHFCQEAGGEAHYKMGLVRDQIGRTAPFLVR